MGMSFQTAKDKARVKQAILRELSTLPRAAQEDVLADIVLTYEEGSGEESRCAAEVSAEFQLTAPAPAKSRQAKKRGRPADHERGKSAAVEAMLRSRPGMSIAELAKAIYPEEEGKDHRIRAILWSLKQQGRANNPQPGKWEVVKITAA